MAFHPDFVGEVSGIDIHVPLSSDQLAAIDDLVMADNRTTTRRTRRYRDPRRTSIKGDVHGGRASSRGSGCIGGG